MQLSIAVQLFNPRPACGSPVDLKWPAVHKVGHAPGEGGGLRKGDCLWKDEGSEDHAWRQTSGVGRNSWWRGFLKTFINYYNIWWRLFSRVQNLFYSCPKKSKFLILFLVMSNFLSSPKISKFLMIFVFLLMSKKSQKFLSKFYINITYLLRQYLRILTLPILHFLHFWHHIQFSGIYLQKILLLRPNGGV